MHVVFVDTTMTTPPTGGATTFLVDVCAALVSRGWKVSVVTQPGPETTTVETLRCRGVNVRDTIWRLADLPEKRAAKLANWANSTGIDVYVVSISPDAGWVALPLLDPNIATISIAHNDVSAFYDPLRHYGPFVDCAVGVSEETQRKIVSDCGMPAERSRQIAYGVHAISNEAARQRSGEATDVGTPLRVGYVGRIVQLQKRVFDFVLLAVELRKLGVNFELHLIGDGKERVALQQEFETQGLNECVKFWGWLSPERVRERLLRLDVFVLLSDYEGLPVALLEALGHAVVPVVTRIASGNVELVSDGINGFVVPVGDIASAAARIKTLAEDRAALNAMRRASWQRAREFSVEGMVEKYVDCFQQAAAGVSARTHREGLANPYPLMPSCISRYPNWLRMIKAWVLALAANMRESSLARGSRL